LVSDRFGDRAVSRSVGAYDVTNAPGVRTNPGAGLLTSRRSAKDQARVVATQYPSFHRVWRLHAALPAYIAYYELGGGPSGWEPAPCNSHLAWQTCGLH